MKNHNFLGIIVKFSSILIDSLLFKKTYKWFLYSSWILPLKSPNFFCEITLFQLLYIVRKWNFSLKLFFQFFAYIYILFYNHDSHLYWKMFFLKNPYINPYSNTFAAIRKETTFYKRLVQAISDLIGILICFVAFIVVYVFMVTKILP